MIVNDLLFFAPGVRFDEVDLEAEILPRQYEQRMAGFYIEPAIACARSGQAFAAGTLLVTCIDAMARYRYGDGAVIDRFTKLVREDLASFQTGGSAERFYREFRCGLVHEARVKNGGQFSLAVDETAMELQGVLIVNPMLLADEVNGALRRYVDTLDGDLAQRLTFAETLGEFHVDDFIIARTRRQ